jgi:enoyl-CoA hydratase/carnithine racemase
MKYFEQDLIQDIHNQTFGFIQVREENHTLYLTLNREEKKNAIHPQMVNELAFALQYAHSSKDIWTIVVDAKGDVFCAGADLKAFMGILGEFTSSIPKPSQEVLIGELFNEVHKPVIAKVEGDVFAGGFFFLAGSTYVVALDSVKFGLPEVKRGLFPFQVMASLLRVMPERKVVDWCIRGYNLPVQDAYNFGLVTHVSTKESITSDVNALIEELHQNSPSAIRFGLEAYQKITSKQGEHAYLMQMLQKTVSTKDGQEGINAFREKRPPVWKGE